MGDILYFGPRLYIPGNELIPSFQVVSSLVLLLCRQCAGRFFWTFFMAAMETRLLYLYSTLLTDLRSSFNSLSPHSYALIKLLAV